MNSVKISLTNSSLQTIDSPNYFILTAFNNDLHPSTLIKILGCLMSFKRTSVNSLPYS